MKIRRIRRGFTTNSSGANEFLPDGGLREGGSATPPASRSGSPAATSPRPVGAPVASVIVPRPALSTVAPWSEPPSKSEPASNEAVFGVATLVVIGAFLAVPIARAVGQYRRDRRHRRDGR